MPPATGTVTLLTDAPPVAGTRLDGTVPAPMGIGPTCTSALTVIVCRLLLNPTTAVVALRANAGTVRLNAEVLPCNEPAVMLVAVAVTKVPAGRTARPDAVKAAFPPTGTV